MTTRKRQHQDQDHDHGQSLWDWFDWAVIVAVVVLVAIAAEWLVGLVVRERLAAGAQRHLRAVRAQEPPAVQESAPDDPGSQRF